MPTPGKINAWMLLPGELKVAPDSFSILVWIFWWKLADLHSTVVK